MVHQRLYAQILEELVAKTTGARNMALTESKIANRCRGIVDGVRAKLEEDQTVPSITST